jgi:hypothetical protein|tara:strand:- start:2976 stop:3365 length:390 start_codon:yes stop_codon:yes gene_type:complete
MDKSVWKKWERWWADAIGGDAVNAVRNPVTGRSGRAGHVPDVESIKFALEVKAGKVVSSRTLKAVQQARDAGNATRKIPIVAQTHKVNQNTAVHLVTMELDVFLDLTKELRKEERRIKKSLDSSKELGM